MKEKDVDTFDIAVFQSSSWDCPLASKKRPKFWQYCVANLIVSTGQDQWFSCAHCDFILYDLAQKNVGSR